MINKFQGETRWLSNFEYADFEYKGIMWKTTEHAYQAFKCRDVFEFLEIMNTETPGQAKRLGQKCKMVPLFEIHKVQLMYEINKCKFEQNKYLTNKLLFTGNQELIEGNTWNDTFWGICDNIGENNLGKILMKIRDELRGD